MFDFNKRRLLMVLAGVGLAAGILSAAPDLSRSLNNVDKQHRKPSAAVIAKQHGELELTSNATSKSANIH